MQRRRLPDGRLEVRTDRLVLMESLDEGPVVRVELYEVVQRGRRRGMEMFLGYLSDRATPRRLEALRLWIAAVPGLPTIPFATVMAIGMRLNQLRAEGQRIDILGPVPYLPWPWSPTGNIFS